METKVKETTNKRKALEDVKSEANKKLKLEGAHDKVNRKPNNKYEIYEYITKQDEMPINDISDSLFQSFDPCDDTNHDFVKSENLYTKAEDKGSKNDEKQCTGKTIPLKPKEIKEEQNRDEPGNLENNPLAKIGNYVGLLQEVCQRKKITNPLYQLTQEIGPPHAKQFIMTCTFNESTSQGAGKTKKIAKQEAAKEILKIIGNKKKH